MKSLKEFIEQNSKTVYLNEFIKEEIIEERFIFTYEIDKLKIDLSNHSDDRKLRNDIYCTDSDIIMSIMKCWKNIKEDIDNNVIKLGDNIGIYDEYNEYLSIPCELQKYNGNYIKIFVITLHKKKNFGFNNVVKVYKTNMSNKSIKEIYNIPNRL